MIGHGITIDEYIEQLMELRKLHGNVECWRGGGDYPQGATGPVFQADGGSYYRKNVVVLY